MGIPPTLSCGELKLFPDVAVDEESGECADYRYDNDEDSEAVGEVLDDCSCAYREPDDEDITP
jgi:hypothetical protein